MTEESLELLEDTQKIIGYHGTSEENANSILKTNFIPSENPDDWLGYGVYLFVEGVSDPINDAKDWATNSAWNKKPKPLNYSRYSVLAVQVSGVNILNTNNIEHLKVFNEVRTLLIKKEKEIWSYGRNSKEHNRILWNMVAEFMNLEIIIHNLYIKTKEQRILKVESNVPNTSVMCVKNIKSIHFDTIQIIDNGDIT